MGLPGASEIEGGITEFAEKPNGALIILATRLRQLIAN